jgi:hypothetical protein
MRQKVVMTKKHTPVLTIKKDTIPRPEILNQVQDDEGGAFRVTREGRLG